MKNILIEVSARHIHLSQIEIDKLFGDKYQLKVYKELSQPGEFAAEETLNIEGPKGVISDVRIIGPAREKTQVEISITDGYSLGVNPPVRVSGNTEKTPGVKLVGPKGEVELSEGLIAAQRHIHMTSKDANKYNVYDKQLVAIKVNGDRGLIFENVVIRVKDTFSLSFQIDTDEANAGGVKNGDLGELISQ